MASDGQDPGFKADKVATLTPLRSSLQALLRMGTMTGETDYTPQEREEYAAITGHDPKPGDQANVFMRLYGTATPSLKQRGLAA